MVSTKKRIIMGIKEYIEKACGQMGIMLTQQQVEQFNQYYNLLIEWNDKINLTRIVEPEEVAIKHFADSLALLNYYNIPQGAKVIDVGTGAGFPGIPLKIARPDINLTLLDSLNKRLIFLGEVTKEIGVEAEIVHSRAEEGSKDFDHREMYDVVVSRAVARLNTLSEYCIPYVRLGGVFVAMKGPELSQELTEAQNAVNTLGGKVLKVEEFQLPDNSSRTIVVIDKDRPTPDKYPRHGSKIKNKPL